MICWRLTTQRRTGRLCTSASTDVTKSSFGVFDAWGYRRYNGLCGPYHGRTCWSIAGSLNARSACGMFGQEKHVTTSHLVTCEVRRCQNM